MLEHDVCSAEDRAGTTDITRLDDHSAAEEATAPLTVRLSPNHMHVFVYLAPSTPDLPAEHCIALVLEQCAQLPLERPVTVSMARECLRAGHAGAWATLASGLEARPPKDGYVQFCVPLSLSTENDLGRPHRYAVRAGAPLARLHLGAPGVAGRDLLGHDLPVRAPGEARLPGGENTCLSPDGLTLLAACDGEVMLHDMLIHIRPVRVVDGPDIALDAPLLHDSDLFIRGAVGARRRVEASGDIHIEGHVYEAHIRSTGGSITVHGSVSGEKEQHTVLEASTDITCGTALHATLRAGNDVYLLARARASVVEALGALYLRHGIEESLHDVELQVWGGLIPAAPSDLEVAMPAERRHERVPLELHGELASHGAVPLAYYPCLIEDLSISGARCRLEAPPAATPERGTLLQLRFLLPGASDYILVMGRVARRHAPGVIGVAFVEAPQRALLESFCARTLLTRPGLSSGSPADRAENHAVAAAPRRVE